jgi:Phytanoyl-CoA dioxygenase (PhyH)
MLTYQQIMHFRTFGYVVLPALLSLDEAATLRAEVADALADAFGPDTERADLGGISGDYLPLAVNRAPFSLSLIADDPRTFLASAELAGVATVPTIGIATRFTGDSRWHTGQGPDVGGVTFWADLEPRAAGSGALRVIPGSHLPDFERQLWAYCSVEPATSGFEGWQWPHVVLPTSPGDVVALHPHLRMSSQGAAPRLTWTIDYLPWPGITNAAGKEAVRGLLLDAVEFDHEAYDRDRWPVWQEWAAGPDAPASRQIAIERLQLLDVVGGEPA